jgi:hypothetical protein
MKTKELEREIVSQAEWLGCPKGGDPAGSVFGIIPMQSE